MNRESVVMVYSPLSHLVSVGIEEFRGDLCGGKMMVAGLSPV